MKKLDEQDFQLSNLIEKQISLANDGNESTSLEKIDVNQIIEQLSQESFTVSANEESFPGATEFYNKSALSGSFDPNALLTTGISETDKQHIFTKLLPDFLVLMENGETKWCLEPLVRKSILKNLLNSNSLQTILEDELPETSQNGVFLRKILSHDNLTLYNEAPDLNYIEALEWVQELEMDMPDLMGVRARFKQLNLLPDQKILLSGGFTGRKRELAIMRAFTTIKQRTSGLSPLLISGIGGVGKSTLIAKFCHELALSEDRLLVLLDFDKPGIDPADHFWLNNEICRQVGDQEPALYKPLKEIRDSYWDRINDINNIADFDSERDDIDANNIILELVRIISRSQTNGKKIILFLDTFEEVIQRNLTEIVFKWLGNVNEHFSSEILKVFISGREMGDLKQEYGRRYDFEEIKVQEFSIPDTRIFLKRLGLPKEQIEQIVKTRLVPRRPLELKLLAKLLNDDPTTTIDSLIAELSSGGKKGKELFIGIIYRRILLRISNPLVRKLASPGLIMRYLNEEVLSEVIFPTLGIPVTNNTNLENTLDELARYTWLSTRDEKGKVWHRKDLRKSMLRLMIIDDIELGKKIHQKAMNYFGSLSTEEGRTEYFYHYLMSANTEESFREISEYDAKEFWNKLGLYIDDLPERSQAVFRFLAKGQVSVENFKLLPERFLGQAKHTICKQLSDKGLYKESLELLTNKRFHEVIFEDEELAGEENWKTETLLNIGLWRLIQIRSRSNNSFQGFKEVVNYLYLQSITTWHSHTFFSERGNFIKQIFDNVSSKRVKTINQISLSRMIAALLPNLDKDFLPSVSATFTNPFINIIIQAAKRGSISYESAYLASLLISRDSEVPEGFHFRIPLTESTFKDFPDAFGDELLGYHFENGSILLKNLKRKKILDYEIQFYNSLDPENCSKIIVELLVNSFPELYNPVKYVIIRLFRNEEDIVELRSLLRNFIPFEIDELSNPHLFLSAWVRKGELFLDDYIRLVDYGEGLQRFLYFVSLIRTDTVLEDILSEMDKQSTLKRFHINSIINENSNKRKMTNLNDMVRLVADASGRESLETPGKEPESNPDKFFDRKGFDEDFLDGWKIKLPHLKDEFKDQMRVIRRGGSGYNLKYQNFSVIMSVPRRLPIITAANINGKESKSLPRVDVWRFDGRLDKSDQWGDELYNKNILDRGHMVRREDPVWGTFEQAQVANVDTFHFTNSCPQVAGVNQKIWLGLENYILSHARTGGMKVNVFTGPFFTDKDKEYRGTQIPLAFWKVVAIVTTDGRKSATAYKISQEKELSDLEFVYAGYKTFQVSIASVMEKTGIDFSELVGYDGFSGYEMETKQVLEEKLEDFESIRV